MSWLRGRRKVKQVQKRSDSGQLPLPGMVAPPGRRVLLIDDDYSICLYVSELLTGEGYRVESARDIDAARRAMERFKPELILLDIMMPGMDGQEIGHELRRRPATRNVPLVLVSGDRQIASKADSIEADAYLSKPFEADDLVAVVAHFLGSRR